MEKSTRRNLVFAFTITAISLLWFAYYAILPFFMIVASDDPVIGSPTLVKARKIIGVNNHKTQGTVSFYNNGDNYILRYENLFTDNCPDMRVYLSKDLNAQDYIDIGPSISTAGNINYLIPENVNVANYQYALYWCTPFRALFNYADISLKKE